MWKVGGKVKLLQIRLYLKCAFVNKKGTFFNHLMISEEKLNLKSDLLYKEKLYKTKYKNKNSQTGQTEFIS